MATSPNGLDIMKNLSMPAAEEKKMKPKEVSSSSGEETGATSGFDALLE